MDEADAFIKAEASREYRALRQFRKLSEEGICYFIFAGFWTLYASVAFDYHSPLKNFGEILTLGELEEEACYDLCTKPMLMCNVNYETDDLVQQIITLSGRRPNLITLICNEIISHLSITDRRIQQNHLDKALESQAVTDEMAIHPLLDEDEETGDIQQASRLDRIVVYASLEQDNFTEDTLLDLIEKAGVKPDLHCIQDSLKRLELAFILGRKGNTYFFRVPLFVRFHRKRNLKKLLEWEASQYKTAGD